VSSFAIDGGGAAIELSAGVLSRIAPNSTARQYLDNDVSSFAIDRDGAVIALSGGVLSRFGTQFDGAGSRPAERQLGRRWGTEHHRDRPG